jgi:uncharacterized membrane protein
MKISQRQAVRWIFDAAVVIKAIDGVLEIAGGYFLVFKPGWIGPVVAEWAYRLLLDHPASRIGAALAAWGDGLSADTERFASFYLIGHGIAKVFIAWGLIREKIWAFPVALAVFGALIAYQVHRLLQTHSGTLAVLIAVDIGVCYIIWREWGFRKQSAPERQGNHAEAAELAPNPRRTP